MHAIRRYLVHFEGAGPAILAATGLVALSGMLPAAAVLALGRALDALPDSAAWLALLVAIAVLQAVLLVLRNLVTRTLAARLVHSLRMRVHEQFHHLRDTSDVGNRLAALSGEADALQYGVSAAITALRNPLTVATLLAAAIHLAPELAWRAALLVPLIGAVAWLGGRLVQTATRNWTAAHRAWLTEVADQHGGLQTTMDLDAWGQQMARAQALSQREAALRARRDWVRAVPTAMVQLGVVVGLVALLAWGAAALERGDTTPGALIAFAAAVALLQRPLVGLAEVWTLFSRSTSALERIEALLEQPLPGEGARGEGFALEAVRVPGRLGPVQLSIPPGEKVAVVGSSGAGKSTLLAVLAGQVAVDGTLRRARTLLLRQDPWVFARSVAENLRLGDPDATDDTLVEALAEVGLDGLADRGLAEQAGGRGQRVSGGEAQRLCIARALLSVRTAPRALLLDEATSEVEPALRTRIAGLLAALPGTVVFASHEPSFARLADRVVWLENGVVRASGPHDELLRRIPAYRAHWDGVGAAA
jgi:subfamily B ATP-binding cassette protein MsbA